MIFDRCEAKHEKRATGMALYLDFEGLVCSKISDTVGSSGNSMIWVSCIERLPFQPAIVLALSCFATKRRCDMQELIKTHT